MKKSMHLGLHAYFEQVSSRSDLSAIDRSTHMRNAEETYWKNQQEEAVLQEFDGHQGYLYFIDMLLEKERCIPLEIDRADLHILYVLSDTGPVKLYDPNVHLLSHLSSHRAQYLYLPPEDYHITFPAGRSTIFGFYFRASIFREGNDQKYSFLHPVLNAYRHRSSLPKCSIDFKVCPATQHYIKALCRNLQARQLHNESFILAKLIQLIALSREKVLAEETKTQHGRATASAARQLLKCYVDVEGQQAHINQLGIDMEYNLAHINRLHKEFFGRSLQKYREELLTQKACDLLRSGTSPTECAYELNYNSPEAFYHFFKKQMKITPSQFINDLDLH